MSSALAWAAAVVAVTAAISEAPPRTGIFYGNSGEGYRQSTSTGVTAAVAPARPSRGEGIHDGGDDGGESCSGLDGAAATVGVPAAVVKTPTTAGISDGGVDGGGRDSTLVEATSMVVPAGSFHE